MKKGKTPLFLIPVLLLSGTTGCGGNDPYPVISPVSTTEPKELPVVNDPPPDSPPLYTTEPKKVPFLFGKVWQLDGILDMETNSVRKLAPGDHADGYSMLFNSDSTATGKILDTEIQVSLSRPFFRLSEAKEENGEAQLFARIASGIIGCEHVPGDSLMKFYNEDYKTCLVFKLKSVLDKTGSMYYFFTNRPQQGRWTIHGDANGNGNGGVLYDGGELYIPEDIPDSFKKQGMKVKFNGDVQKTPYIEVGTDRFISTESFYLINLSSLDELL
ncbi:MAG: hypothetical protein LBJ60_07870 [Tannerellaceae bacterium]|jgi:hypothetical protein|nr:hypothetical protein [Tannerellaceae bacterium]